MPTDNRLSRMLHVLIHMDHIGAPVTSETISRMLDTNPVVVRRTMAGLRAAGYLTSVKGHGGGWTLARPLDEVTLRDIHLALGSPRVFAIGLADDDPRWSLSPTGDLREAAANLFRMLREADRERPVGIAVSPIPSHGLGEAINDRLKRAAGFVG